MLLLAVVVLEYGAAQCDADLCLHGSQHPPSGQPLQLPDHHQNHRLHHTTAHQGQSSLVLRPLQVVVADLGVCSLSLGALYLTMTLLEQKNEMKMHA